MKKIFNLLLILLLLNFSCTSDIESCDDDSPNVLVVINNYSFNGEFVSGAPCFKPYTSIPSKNQLTSTIGDMTKPYFDCDIQYYCEAGCPAFAHLDRDNLGSDFNVNIKYDADDTFGTQLQASYFRTECRTENFINCPLDECIASSPANIVKYWIGYRGDVGNSFTWKNGGSTIVHEQW